MLASNIAVKGMNTDVLEKFQPDGTYRFALNAVLETASGDIQGISNEEGNTYCAVGFPTSKKVIGHVLTDTEEVILFLFDPASNRPAHEIGSYNPSSCSYTTIAKGECLNFSDQHQINAIFRLKNGCTKYVYFTDTVNPYRVVNITDTSDWVNPSTKSIISCNKIKYSRPYKVPKIKGYTGNDYVDGVSDSGGQLLYGNYSFAVRLIDYDDNPTDWITFSRYFPIFYGPLASTKSYSTYNKVVGASNLPDEVGYKAPSSKSINLEISNLDTQFSKFQVAVIKRTTTSGNVTGVDILQPQNIYNPSSLTNVTDNFTYTGSSSQLFLESSLDELFSEKVVLDRVVAHTQADSRLMVANVSTTPRDYKGYQRHATKIKTEWTKTPILLPNPSSKTASGYQDFSGLQDDEVYAFGIVYIHSDGTHSPVFHIPGRPMDIVTAAASGNAYINDANPLDSHTVSPSDPNIVDLNLDKRWQVYNTYTKTTATSGYMGYHQTNTKYPKMTVPCDTDPDGYWGRDFFGNLIDHNTNIRHHRTPLPQSRTLPTSYDYEVCGVKFTMTTDYPSSDIVGHYYVMGDRSDGNKTVLDAGILNSSPGVGTDERGYITNIGFYQPSTINNNTTGLFLSNQVQYLSKIQEGAYVRMFTELQFNNSYTYNYATANTVFRFNREIELDSALFGLDEGTRIQGTPVANPVELNYKVLTTQLLAKNDKYLEALGPQWWNATGNSVQTSEGHSIKNTSNSVNIAAISLNRAPAVADTTGKIYHVAIKVYNDVFNNLYYIRYKKLHNSFYTKSSGTNLSNNIYSGDILVSTSEFAENYSVEYEPLKVSHNSKTFLIPGEINASAKMYDFTQDGKENTYRGRFNVVNSSADALLDYIVNDKLYKEGDTIFYHSEPHRISFAYNHYLPDKIYLPLPADYSVCSDCNDEDYPYRIYYSEQDTQESTRDYFRYIKPNNYKDLEGYVGQVTDMVTFRDNLYVLTTNSIQYIPYRPQSLSTEAFSVYLGTGEVLSIPAKQLKTTDYAFGGTTHFKSRTLTEYGVAYIDDISARPFLISEGLRDLSLTGMRSFWQENGYLFLNKQFKEKNSSYPHYSTSSPIGIGYITTYDPRYKRIIVHKRDFKIVPKYWADFKITSSSSSNDVLYFDGTKFVYRSPSGIVSYPTLEDTQFFENHSWTMSYSFLTENWVSFHSYLPSYMFNNYRNVFTNNIYKHEGPYQTFYGTKYDFVVDYVNKLDPKAIKTFSYAVLRARSYRNGTYSNTIFDRAIGYNSRQSTGTVILQRTSPFQADNSITISPLKEADSTYRISNLRDSTISNLNPIWDGTSFLTSSPFSYIDKIPNTSNIDYSKSLFEEQRLKDYYLGLRLFYKPTYNDKLVVDILDIESSSRNR